MQNTFELAVGMCCLQTCNSVVNIVVMGLVLGQSLMITKYDSTLYIGMDEVLAHYACTFENSNLHFHFT